MKKSLTKKLILLFTSVFFITSLLFCSNQLAFSQPTYSKFKDRLNYMITYGALDSKTIALAKTYKMVIIHPFNGNVTRSQVKAIQQGVNSKDSKDNVKVIGYISVGEDLRTINLTDKQMLTDSRFVGNGTGPRVDPRGPEPNGGTSLDGINILGNPSPSGSGFASFYLDDNNLDGHPDRNSYFHGCFVNAGDPTWFNTIDKMKFDGKDKLPGLAEILTTNYGRGLGCDGVFLDTIDTCAPNFYTDSNSGNQSEFEWTAPGFSKFIENVSQKYPTKIIVQNRGLFFFHPSLQQYKFTTRPYINYLMFESYRLNSNSSETYSPTFFPDNKYNYMPKIMAEAGRPDGFSVISLGYAEGPSKSISKKTLVRKSIIGKNILLKDIYETQDFAGFRHYITNAGVTNLNSFVKNNTTIKDTTPPHWYSTWNDNGNVWPAGEPTPRIGISFVEQTNPNEITVSWDVALDYNPVHYSLYLSETPFDFENDPNLKESKKIVLTPGIGNNYSNGASINTFPYQAVIPSLITGNTYYLIIRASDSVGNEEKNTFFKTIYVN